MSCNPRCKPEEGIHYAWFDMTEGEFWWRWKHGRTGTRKEPISVLELEPCAEIGRGISVLYQTPYMGSGAIYHSDRFEGSSSSPEMFAVPRGKPLT